MYEIQAYRLQNHKRSENQAITQSRTTVKKRQQQETDAVCLMVIYDCTPPTGLDPPHRVVGGPHSEIKFYRGLHMSAADGTLWL